MLEFPAHFFVLCIPGQTWSVIESGFGKSLTEFPDVDSAQRYALRVAQSKSSWKVDIYDSEGNLAQTFKSGSSVLPETRGLALLSSC